MKRRKLTDYRKEASRNKIPCPYCMRNNRFILTETTSGYMVFECTRCDRKTIMPFRNCNVEKKSELRGKNGKNN